MAERQHTGGKAKNFKRTVSFKPAGLAGEHTGRITSSKRAKRAGLVDPLEAAGEILRPATERAGNPIEKLVKDQIAALNSGLQETLDLLGGDRVLGLTVQSELDAHELLHRGLPRAALSKLVDNLHVIQVDEATEAMGMSLRTLQRHKSMPVVLLDVQQSGRTWKFAEILAKATRVLGSQDEAEQWLRRPAIGLDQARPIDLLTSPIGVRLVEDYLGRLEYDVYT